MPLTITQSYHTQVAGTYHSRINADDKGKSHICASRSKKSKHDNHMITGYIFDNEHHFVSSFQLLVHGDTSHHYIDFIWKKIIPKIEALNMTSQMSHHDATGAVHGLFHTILKTHRGSHLLGKSLSLGFAITYHDGFALFCTGFATDNVKIYMQNKKTIQSNIPYNSSVCDYSHPIPNIEKRAVLFNTVICPGDEIVMCNLDHDRNLDPREIDTKDSLFYRLIAQFKTLQYEQTELRSNNDWLFGRMIPPEGGLYFRLTIIQQMKAMLVDLADCIRKYKDLSGLGIFPVPKKSIQRLEWYFKILSSHNEDLLICMLVTQSMLTDPYVSHLLRHSNIKVESSLAAMVSGISLCNQQNSILNDKRLTTEEIELLKQEIKLSVSECKELNFIPGISI